MPSLAAWRRAYQQQQQQEQERSQQEGGVTISHDDWLSVAKQAVAASCDVMQ